MSKRLQVLLDEKEMRELRRIARAQRVTVAEWVRQALRTARRGAPLGEADSKLKALSAAARHAFPAPDVEQMLAEIEQGYGASSGR